MKASHKYRSVLGIALDERRLEAAVLQRTGRGIEVRQAMSRSMALDPLVNEPELVGREILNLLTEAGIREKRCVLCLPLKRALTMQTALPDLAEPDLSSFIQMQAEREFPLPIEHLSLSIVRSGNNGTRRAIVAGVLANHLESLLKALRNAGLRPIGVTLGATSLAEESAAGSEARLLLLAWEGSIDLVVAKGDTLWSLRSIADIASYDHGRPEIHVDAIARQLRITLGQIDPGIAGRIRAIRIYGPARLADDFRRELAPYGERMGLAVEAGGASPGIEAEPDVMAETSPAVLNSAARYLMGEAAEFEFLPPRTNAVQRALKRVSKRSAMLPAALALTVVLAVVALFFYQHWRLSRLRSNWGSIEARVTDVQTIQNKIKLYRPWFEDTAPNLLAMRSLTEAFPEDGAVWAKSLEIRTPVEGDGFLVTCEGKTRSGGDWLRMQERLGTRSGVRNVRFQQQSGTNPIQFRLNFLWKEETGDER